MVLAVIDTASVFIADAGSTAPPTGSASRGGRPCPLHRAKSSMQCLLETLGNGPEKNPQATNSKLILHT